MSQSTKTSNTVQIPGKLGARLSIWENASNKKPIQRKLTKVPKKITKTWGPTNQPKEPHKSKQHRSSSIDAQRLQHFSHCGEKYFKILIDSIILYKDKLFQISSATDLFKNDIVSGTYITNKIVLFGEPYNLYCDSKYVEPVDINHSLYLQYQKQKQKQKQNKQFIDRVNTIEQQLEQITEAQESNKQEDEENGNVESKTNEEMMTCAPELVLAPELPQQPKKNARAYFSDQLIGPKWAIPYDTTGAWSSYSDYVGEGSYPENNNAFPNASRGTFDAIAIDANTRVIVYEKANFEGDVLLDETGPMLINNVNFQSSYPQLITDTFQDPEIQNNYPSNVRVWSETNMQLWTTGSVKIVAANK